MVTVTVWKLMFVVFSTCIDDWVTVDLLAGHNWHQTVLVSVNDHHYIGPDYYDDADGIDYDDEEDNDGQD